MTSTLAASSVRDLAPLAASSTSLEQHRQESNLQQRYNDYDSVVQQHNGGQQQQLQQRLKSSTNSGGGGGGGGANRFNGHDRPQPLPRNVKRSNNLNNNNNNNTDNKNTSLEKTNSSNSRLQNTRDISRVVQPRTIHKNITTNNNNNNNHDNNNDSNGIGGRVNGRPPAGLRSRGGIGDGRGSPSVIGSSFSNGSNQDSMTSDYDNVIPSGLVVEADAVARLSKVEEEEGGVDDGDDDDGGGDNNDEDEKDEGPIWVEQQLKKKQTHLSGDLSITGDNGVVIATRKSSASSSSRVGDDDRAGDAEPRTRINDNGRSTHDEQVVLVGDDTTCESHAANGRTVIVSGGRRRHSESSASAKAKAKTDACDVGDGDGVSRERVELDANITHEKRRKSEGAYPRCDRVGVRESESCGGSDCSRFISDRKSRKDSGEKYGINNNDNDDVRDDDSRGDDVERGFNTRARHGVTSIPHSVISPNSVGKNERLLNGDTIIPSSIDTGDNTARTATTNNKCNGTGGKNNFVADSRIQQARRGDRVYECRQVTPQQKIRSDSENDSVKREGYPGHCRSNRRSRSSDSDNNNNNDNDNGANRGDDNIDVGKFPGAVTVRVTNHNNDVCSEERHKRVIHHSKDYDNVRGGKEISHGTDKDNGNNKSSNNVCESNGKRFDSQSTDEKVECKSKFKSSPSDTQSKYNGDQRFYCVNPPNFNMGAKQSKRTNNNKAGSVSYDHGQAKTKIEMKELTRNGDIVNNHSDSNHNSNAVRANKRNDKDVNPKSRDQIHGEVIDDEKRSISIDSYQTIPEYPDQYSKGSTSAVSVSIGETEERISSPHSLSSHSQEDLLSPNRSSEGPDGRRHSETRNSNGMLETDIDPAPIYAVVNKNRNRSIDFLSPPVVEEDPIDEMDGDYSVPSFGQSRQLPAYTSVMKTTRQHIVNPGRRHKETVSACVSVSSLASSERGGEGKSKPHVVSPPEDDEYDDAFYDPNNRSQSQMKKSSTVDSITSQEWKGSLKFPRSHSSSRDYFSLGRRPKVKRSRTLVDTHGKAVSMDTLLKARRRGSSFRNPVTPTTPVDNLSVEDILKSCEDFDADSLGVRSRSESATSVSGSSRHFPFFLVAENDVPEVTGDRRDAGLNNLNASMTGSISNDSANSSMDISQSMNIINGEEVELRPSRSQIKRGHSNSINKSKFPTGSNSIPTSPNQSVILPPVAPKPVHQQNNSVQSVSQSSTSSSSPHDLKAASQIVPPQSLPLRKMTHSTSSGFIPSDSNLTFQDTTSPSPEGQTSTNTSRSPVGISTAPHPQNQQSNTSKTFQNHPSFEPPATQPPYKTTNSTMESSASSSGIFLASPTSEMSSTSIISSPDGNESATNSVTSPYPVFSPSPTGALPPSKFSHMTSLTVDVTSPLSEGNTSQNSSPAPRSPNSIAKLEAVEAIKWLRAAGFPQYAQMFDDGLFPIELALVEKDHDFLDRDSIQSLFRRLETLNKYAGMKIDAHQRKKAASEEEEEDDICALSERWEYQKSVRRWSRKDLALSPRVVSAAETADLQNTRGSHDSLLADQDSGSQTGDSPLLNTKMPHKDIGDTAVEDVGTAEQEDANIVSQHQHQQPADESTQQGDQQTVGGFPISPRLRRAASERIKTAKNLWKKMEGGLKSKKSRRHPRNIMEISDPVVAVADQENMQAKLQRLNCVDISPSSEQAPSVQDSNNKSPVDTVSSPTSPPTTQQLSPLQHQLESSMEDDNSLPLRFRSRSALESRSVRERPSFLHSSKDHPDKRSSDTLNSHDTQCSVASSTGTDSSLKEYYTAQSQLLKTLESAHPNSRSNSFRKNSNDTGLMEIFLLPQDHQPGKFPRLLQNGYIETDSRTGQPNQRYNVSVNTPDRLGAGESSPCGNRVSVYDNFSTSSDGSKRTVDKSSRSLDEIQEDDSSKNVEHSGNDGLYISEISDSSNTDRDPSQQNSSYRELRDKILKEASSPSLPLTDTETDSEIQEPDTTRSPKGVSHSVSVDSYLKDNCGSNFNNSQRRSSSCSSTNVEEPTDVNPERSLSQQYDEFDLILKEMYANISDLTKRMSEKTEDSTFDSTTTPVRSPYINSSSSSSSTTTTSSPLTSSSSSSTSSSSTHKKPARPTLILPEETHQGYQSFHQRHRHHHHHHHHHHHDHHKPTDSLTYDSEGRVVPVSPNSDPILSPASPLSHRLGDDSVDTDGITDPDQENSSSGGADSHTGGSVSDPEGGLDLSHDDSLEQIPAMTRERRDSGVGHSLTRAPSDRRRKKLRWHSFQKCHRPDISSRSMQINSLTVGQLVWLQKLSLLKLTGIMEKCLPVNKSGWNWMMPRFMKRHKTPDFSDKNVFGVPLSVMAQRTGQPLPQCVLYAMRYLRRTSHHAVGIFRKSGVKSKIQSLIDHLEANPDTTDFEDMNAYNVADMIKTFFRDLPECLLTNKLSETFRSIYTHVPKSQLLEAIQAAILLLPDENREVLQSLLLFLSDISMHEADHQMNATNLAVCFTPTVFMLGFKQTPLSHSPKRNRKAAASAPGVPDPREIMEQKTSQDCLLLMITECKKLFTVPPKLFRQVQVQSLANKEVSPIFELSGEEGTISAEIRAFGQERVQKVLKEAHDKNRGWLPVMTISNIEVSHRKPLDDCPLKEWKLVVDVDAPPIEVLRRIMHERHAWDEDLLSWSVVERIDPHSDIFQYVLNSMAPHPSRHFCVLRYWRTDLSKGACALITMSVDHADVQDHQGVAAIDYGSLYLMEPCGSGRSRLTHVTRMDTRGRCPEWYFKVFGHIVGNFIERLRDSFKQETVGPETKV